MDPSILLEAKRKDQEVINFADKTKIRGIFEENTKLLKEFIKENGWPTKEKYDSEVISAAWLIAQHSDHDPIFQLKCLSLIIANFDPKDKEIMQDMAFLLDRVLVNMNQEQVFGTQLNGKFVVPDVIDKKNLNSLRKNFGLESIGKYIKRVMEFSDRKED